MSDLLLKWLNQDVGLSRTVKSFEGDFCNGYLFGELLSKHGLLAANEFGDSFVDGNNLSAKKNNLSCLKSLINTGAGKDLNVRLKDEDLRQIMNEDRGAALRLLFQLRKKFVELPNNKLPQHKKDFVPRIPREEKGQNEERFFESTLQKVPRTAPRAVYELHTKGFIDEHTKQMQKAADEEETEHSTIKLKQSDFRASRHSLMSEHKARVTEINISNEESWQANMRRKHRNVENDLLFEKKTLAREQAKLSRIRAAHQEDCGYAENEEGAGIGWFEKNLQRIGIDTSEHSGKHEATIDASNAKELYDGMREQLPHAGQLKVECSNRMKKIKDTKKASDFAQRERDQRLRRQMVDQRGKQKDMDAVQLEEGLLRRLMVDAAEYRKEATAYDLDERYRAAVLLQRESKQMENAEKAACKMDEAWNKFATKCREERAEKLADRKLAKEKAAMRGAAGLEEPERADEVSSDGDEAEYWATDPFPHQGTVSKPVSPVPAHERSMELCSEPAEAGADSNIVAAKALVDCIRDARTAEYLFSRGDWGKHTPPMAHVRSWLEELQSMLPEESLQIMSSEVAPQLGALVRSFFALETPKLQQPELAADYLPVIAITGNPIKLGNLGVSLKAAQGVCAELGFELVEPRQVLGECIALAQKEDDEPEPEWPPLARMVQLGRMFLEESSKNAEATVPQTLFAEMVFRKIEVLSAPPPPPADAEDDAAAKAKAKGKPKKGEEEKKEAIRPKGVILLGYMAELGQHVPWEAALRGYTSPVLRINEGESDLQAQLSSIIAPFSFQEQEPQAYMGLPTQASIPAPLRLLRMRYEEHDELCKSLLTEAAGQKAWQIGELQPLAENRAPSREKGKGKPAAKDAAAEPEPAAEVPAVLCQGYEFESLHLANPVDRAWLYEDAQRHLDAFTGPLKYCQDMMAPSQQDGEEAAEPIEQILCRQVMEIATELEKEKEKKVETEEPPPADDAGDAEADGEEKEPIVTEALEEPPVEVEGDAGGDPCWPALPVDLGLAAKMKHTWLEGLSFYVTKVHATISEMHEQSANYSQALVRMQRGFLEFLQCTDEKTNVMSEYLQNWPQRSFGRQPDDVNEEVDELSDHLWQFADRRRAECVEEHARLAYSGFWEKHATECVRLAAELHSVECRRFKAGTALLSSAQGLEAVNGGSSEGLVDESPEGLELSSLDDFISWISGLTESIASSPLPLPVASFADPDAEGEDGAPRTKTAEMLLAERPELETALRAAVGAEKLELVQRLRAVEAWVAARLRAMRDQLDEALARMDDWIRDRVRVENDAIKAAIAQLKDGGWVEEGGETPSGRSLLRSGSKSGRSLGKSGKAQPSPTGGPVRRKRREVLKALESRTLDVDILAPEKLDVALGAESTGGPSGRWEQQMLLALLQELVKRSSQRWYAAASSDAVLATLLGQRASGFNFDIDLVPPAWVTRSEAALAAFCSVLVTPAWGNVAIDITELLLTLTFHERGISWPTSEALLASRQLLESSASGLTAAQLAAYPDIPVSEELFMRLPLWDESIHTQLRDEIPAERAEGIKRWIFQILFCFQDEATACLPAELGRPVTGTVSARRLFSYLGLGATPMQGFELALKLMISPLPVKTMVEGEEAEEAKTPEILVQHLWSVLFSCQSRPTSVVTSRPELADFCDELLPPPEEEPVPAAPAGKPGKGAPVPEPVEKEVVPPPPPEERVVAFDENLVRNKAVLSGLCTHGGLFCRRRALSTLFPPAGAVLHTTAEAASARGLPSLVPDPPTPEESPAPEDEM